MGRGLPWTWICTRNDWAFPNLKWWAHWAKSPVNLYRDLKRIWYRGLYGHGTGDVFDLNDYLCPLILNCLEKFRVSNCAHPCGMTFEEWQSKIDLMIDGWKAMDEHLSDADHLEDPTQRKVQYKSRMKRWKAGMAEFVKYYDALWI